ncbi:hypothetical protein GBAR_LOCUS13089, partial [Geodia barretti]
AKLTSSWRRFSARSPGLFVPETRWRFADSAVSVCGAERRASRAIRERVNRSWCLRNGCRSFEPERLSVTASIRSRAKSRWRRPSSLWQNPRGPVLPVGARPAIHPARTTPLRPPTGRTGVLRCVSVEIHLGQFSRWGLLPHAPCRPGASPPPGDWPTSALTWVSPQAASPPRFVASGPVGEGRGRGWSATVR